MRNHPPLVFAPLPHPELEPQLLVPLAPSRRLARERVELGAEPEQAQHALRVGPERDACADLRQARGLLEEREGDAGAGGGRGGGEALLEGERGDQAGDAAADDGDAERRWCVAVGVHAVRRVGVDRGRGGRERERPAEVWGAG